MTGNSSQRRTSRRQAARVKKHFDTVAESANEVMKLKDEIKARKETPPPLHHVNGETRSPIEANPKTFGEEAKPVEVDKCNPPMTTETVKRALEMIDLGKRMFGEPKPRLSLWQRIKRMFNA